MTTPRHIGLSFTADSYRAMLDGLKTQTRRVIKPQPPTWLARQIEAGTREIRHIAGREWGAFAVVGDAAACRSEDTILCPWQPGDLLYWSNEAVEFIACGPPRPQVAVLRSLFDGIAGSVKIPARVKYPHLGRWPGRHLPVEWARPERWEVVSVRAERLQEISGEDAIAEGVFIPTDTDTLCGQYCQDADNRLRLAYASYELMWDSINARRHPWSKNEWVWAITYKEHKA